MFFKTNHFQYRYHKTRGWQRRRKGFPWEPVPVRFWDKIQKLRHDLLQKRNRTSTLAEIARIKLDKKYNEHTKKTTKWAYRYGIPLENII